MKIYRMFALKSLIVLSFFVFLLHSGMQTQAVSDDIQIYNRDEKVILSKPLIFKNEDYYISVDDLSKINIQYQFTQSDKDFQFRLFSQDIYGTENTLLINATSENLYKWDAAVGNFVAVKSYSFSNKMISKKSLPINTNGEQIVTESMGDFTSVIISDNNYYISLRAIATAVSYEYNTVNNIITLWITDSEHHVINGKISLPDEEVALQDGININISICDAENDKSYNSSSKNVYIPQGENEVYYFIETDFFDEYYCAIFEFDAQYETVCEFYNDKNKSMLNVKAVSVLKTDSKVPVSINVTIDNDKCYAVLKNISDKLLSEQTLYCAYYSEGTLMLVKGIFIDNLTAYSGYETYTFENPTDFHRIDEIKAFVWGKEIEPLSFAEELFDAKMKIID